MTSSTVISMEGTAPPRAVIAYTVGDSRYLNITSRCSLRCDFCPKTRGDWGLYGRYLRLIQEPSVSEVVAATGDPRAYQEVVFCGLGEPTLRLYDLLEIARQLRQKGAFVRVTTDGLANRVYGRDVTPDFEDNVDAVSISLNAPDAETYDRLCRPPWPDAYASVLDFARRIRDFVPEVTLTAIDGVGVDIGGCRQVSERLRLGFRVRILNDCL